jgi:hypothetical protein
MRTLRRAYGEKGPLVFSWITAFAFFAVASLAQTAATRILSEIDPSDRASIQGTRPPMARPENDAGRVPSGTKLQSMSIVFSRTATQEANLQSLITSQQDPTSPNYHKWLTPGEFATRFGVSDSDIAKVQSWLQQQGFAVEGVAESKNRITFSGTVEQAEAAFGTELHYYNVNGQKHYAPSADISVPTALSSLVQTVANLSTFRPRPHVQFGAPQRVPQANFTSSQTGSHFLTPEDIATIYNINASYNEGYTGAGESIAIVGQSSIVLSDIEDFQRASGLTTKDPTLVLVPNSGTAAIVSGDEAESDLDLEYSSTIAKGATIYFVYVGNNSNYSAWDSLTYAVDSRIASVISISYGECESELSSSDYSTLNATLAQAASQGQSIIAAAGDSGSTDCYAVTGLTTTQQEALAVDFPASSQYVTGMGGTEFPAVDVSSSNTSYWESASGSDVIGSALSYIPEQVWNDDSLSSGISSGGGGASTLTSRPSWQTGVTGITSGNYRLVPDISLTASPNNAGFLYCSSDSTSTGVTGSCSNGFRDSNNTYLTVAGGTSFDVPIFAGMVAIINEKLNSTGQGVVNSTLYTLAANSTTYASAFHDVTSGSNKCTAGTSYCSSAGASQYPATTGYDEATGLGSIDFHNLLMAWPATSSSSVATTTTLSAATLTPASGASDIVTIAVASASSSSTAKPSGTLTVTVDGATETSALPLTNGSATYTFSSVTAGSHTITATYSGDSTYAGSTGSLTLTVGSTNKSFVLTASNVVVSAGSSGTSAITITPQNGYTGTIGWSVSSSSSISNACFSLPNATVSGTSAVTATLTIYTSASACASGAVKGALGNRRKFIAATRIASRGNALAPLNSNPVSGGLPLAGLLFVGLFGVRFRRVRTSSVAFLLVAAGLAVWGCSGASSSTSSNTADATKGSYTLTIVGTDTSSSAITTSTTMTLTID